METEFLPFDIYRMFVGEQPLLFYAEVIIRTLIIYFYTLLMVRWIGGRGLAQLSMVEFVLVIALGSAVGDSMFYPDIPLLIAMVVITVVIGTNKLLDVLIQSSERAKVAIEGQPLEMVHHGRLLKKGLEDAQMSCAEVKGLLRLERIRNLGQVEHAFLESSGKLSVFTFDKPRPGLPIVPPTAFADRSGTSAGGANAPDGLLACENCGNVATSGTVPPDGACQCCGKTSWVPAEHPGASDDD